MATTLNSLLSDLQSELKIDPQNRIRSQDTKEKAINTAYTRVQKDCQYGLAENQDIEVITTSSGTQEYALPTDYRQIVQVSLVQNSTSNSQVRLSKSTKQRAYLQPTLPTGQPYTYYIRQGNIGFYLIPNSAFTVNVLYNKVLPVITSTQSSVLPFEFDRAITIFAAYTLNMQPGGREQIAQYKLQEYNDTMNTLLLTFLYHDINGVFAYQRSGNMNAPYGTVGSAAYGVGTSFNANS